MAYLKKTERVTYTPASPGEPGYPGEPARPAWLENLCGTNGMRSSSGSSSSSNTRTVCWNGPALLINHHLGTIEFVEREPGCTVITTTDRGESGSSGSGISYNPNPQSCFVYHEATAGTPAIPAAPATKASTLVDKQAGWNSVAWSVEPLEIGQAFYCTRVSGSRGIIIALTEYDGLVPNINDIPHALFIDVSGVRIMEYGGTVDTMPISPGIRIERGDDGYIRFVTSETVRRNSLLSSIEPVHIAVMLYEANDGIFDFGIEDASEYVHSASVTIEQESELVFAPDGQASLIIEQESELSFFDATGASNYRRLEIYQPVEMYFNATAQTTLDIILPSLSMISADGDYCQMDIQLPAIEVEQYEETLTPAERVEMNIVLPNLFVVSNVFEGDIAEMDIQLPSLAMISADGPYGYMDIQLPGLICYSEETGEVLNAQQLLVSYSWAAIVDPDDVVEVVTYDVTVTDTMTISATFSGDITMVESILETIVANATASGDVNMLESIVIRAVVSGSATNAVDGVNAIQSEQVWVLNLDSGATTQYENYGFNSYLSVGGVEYGVAPDGLYELNADTDAGDDIDAGLYLAISQLGDVREKRSFAAYVAVASDDVMILKVVVDGGTEYVYEARSSSTSVQTHRFDLGRGLRGTHWQFSLLNKDGADFDIQQLEFMPLVGKRRV